MKKKVRLSEEGCSEEVLGKLQELCRSPKALTLMTANEIKSLINETDLVYQREPTFYAQLNEFYIFFITSDNKFCVLHLTLNQYDFRELDEDEREKWGHIVRQNEGVMTLDEIRNLGRRIKLQRVIDKMQ